MKKLIFVILLFLWNLGYSQTHKEYLLSDSKIYDYIEKKKLNWTGRNLFAIKNKSFVWEVRVVQKQLEGYSKLKHFYYIVTEKEIKLLFTDFTRGEAENWFLKKDFIVVGL